MRRLWGSGICACVLVACAVALLIGQGRERDRAKALVKSLLRSDSAHALNRVRFSSLSELPSPVVRYFRHVLTAGQPLIRSAAIWQSGTIRTSTTSDRWRPFTAEQVVAPVNRGFLWNAKVQMPLALHMRVLDSYADGVGSGRVTLLSALAVGSDSGVPELNSGALHRYLAEAVWYPTALLPQSGVAWAPIGDHAAMATLTDKGTTVSLEFRFNDADEVVSVYSPGRFSRIDGTYRQVPWEGHFRNYALKSGMRVPRYGEVGWYEGSEWKVVWKAEITQQTMELDH